MNGIDIAKVAWVSITIFLGMGIVMSMLRNKTEKNVNQKNINVVYVIIVLLTAATFSPINVQIGDRLSISTDQQMGLSLGPTAAGLGAIEKGLIEGLAVSRGSS